MTYSPLGGVTGNVSASSNRLDNSYKSVTEQAGIYAGSEGFDINVKGNTDLKGAVIDSTATADKNSLTTGTLSVSDIANSSETKSSGIGLSYDGEKSNSKTAMLGDKGLIPNIPMATNESDSSITKSGIAEGSITITKPSEQKQDVSKINRNTEGTANVLKNSFDPQKVQERQETAALFSELAFNAIHELSHKRSLKQDGEISSWTKEERAMAHTLVGLISSEIAGSGNPMSTLTAAGMNALVVTALTKDAKAKEYFEKHPDQLQWASAVLGAAVAKTTGGSAQSGASIAAKATKENLMDTQTWNHYKKSLLEIQRGGEGVALENRTETDKTSKTNDTNLFSDIRDNPVLAIEIAKFMEANPNAETYKGYVIRGYDVDGNYSTFQVELKSDGEGATIAYGYKIQNSSVAYTPEVAKLARSSEQIVNASAQMVGGASEAFAGISTISATSGMGTVVGGALLVDGFSNMSGAISNYMNILDNGGRNWNFVENLAIKVSPEYGQTVYDGTQLIMGIYGVIKGSNVLLGTAIADRKTGNAIFKTTDYYNGYKGKITIQQLLLNDDFKKKQASIDVVAGTINVMAIESKHVGVK